MGRISTNFVPNFQFCLRKVFEFFLIAVEKEDVSLLKNMTIKKNTCLSFKNGVHFSSFYI